MALKETILVTGGNGFIGTNLVKLLLNSGKYQVVNLDALTYAANPLSLADLDQNSDYIFNCRPPGVLPGGEYNI